MKIYNKPVIAIGDLEEELKLQFNIDVEEKLANILFDSDFINDCYKSYYYASDCEYTGKPWQNEENIRISNCVNAILRDLLPNQNRILIDVSW